MNKNDKRLQKYNVKMTQITYSGNKKQLNTSFDGKLVDETNKKKYIYKED